ncbi:trehalose 6-phosphate synthase [Cryobacterium mesophilum]|uniref:Trehalose-6-phosphate synthase n=1 Tax=Terrimesophilobacter mesophilus TaxID=433647 RepID=A0A4R8V8G5_9MICO|nr:trehalose-6-phosphate synthase [Terrimesophilobacter mesophilus]MBB5632598.1 trehalose 6-phosphate synthase [Terrimesophilobacter mesophilus]TFB79414.1 trehalose-6-phosphate synthase [Terrimesophilobacter mesophilus]
MSTTAPSARLFDFIVASNRLPVDSVVNADGGQGWSRSPGGLVAALEPVMHSHDGAWVGWAGEADLELDPFDIDGLHLVPVRLSAAEVREYYEGFSNDTLWPLYHDVIAAPSFHREWWDAYRAVNQRFADIVAAVSAKGAVVWVQDYQLQLVPKMLRELRPDLTIGFFDHIPFPPYGLFSQLPWRTHVIEGLLGADVVGFQRDADAGNFAQAVRRLKGYATTGSRIEVPIVDESPGVRVFSPIKRGAPSRTVIAKKFPISIDADIYRAAAKDPGIRARARQIRADLGNPAMIMLGVDRLDYTKGIRHRLQAYGELLAEGRINPTEVILVQVASPSRERVKSYIDLRDEIELTVGRINGEYSELGHQAISYHHHSYPREEMVALYLAADIMLVTALRDGMNLVAKEYVASRFDDDGVLVLSEFAGASDELTRAIRVNPHDIDGLKDAFMRAVEMPHDERRSRMRYLRKRVFDNDVEKWSNGFLEVLAHHRHEKDTRSR